MTRQQYEHYFLNYAYEHFSKLYFSNYKIISPRLFQKIVKKNLCNYFFQQDIDKNKIFSYIQFLYDIPSFYAIDIIENDLVNLFKEANDL